MNTTICVIIFVLLATTIQPVSSAILDKSVPKATSQESDAASIAGEIEDKQEPADIPYAHNGFNRPIDEYEPTRYTQSKPSQPWWHRPQQTHSLFEDDVTSLTIGFRFLHFDLLNNVQGEPFQDSFIGSINRLEAKNEIFNHRRPYIQLTGKIQSWLELGVGASWDKLIIATRDQGQGDGDAHMQAQYLYAIVAFPNVSRLTPFAEIGQGRYKNTFQPLPEWYAGGRREFVLEDSTALHLAGGCDIRIWEGLSINLYVRYSDVDVDGIYIFRGDSRPDTPFTFTMEHIAYGAGLQYAF